MDPCNDILGKSPTQLRKLAAERLAAVDKDRAVGQAHWADLGFAYAKFLHAEADLREARANSPKAAA